MTKKKVGKTPGMRGYNHAPRYSDKDKQKIVDLSYTIGIKTAAHQCKVSSASIVLWRRKFTPRKSRINAVRELQITVISLRDELERLRSSHTQIKRKNARLQAEVDEYRPIIKKLRKKQSPWYKEGRSFWNIFRRKK